MHRLWLGICALSLMLSGAGLTLAAETSEPKSATVSHTTAKTTPKKGKSRHWKTSKATTGKGTAQTNVTTTSPAGEAH